MYQSHYADSTNQHLPTHENYPDDAHTRVIYHSPRGHVQGMSYITVQPNPNLVSIPTKLPSSRYLYKPAPAKHSTYQPPVAPPTQYYEPVKEEQYYIGGHQMKTNTIYTDSNGQSYIYVLPSQLQGHEQLYYPEYGQSQEQDLQTEAPYNYHAHQGKIPKERSKKSSGKPIIFEDPSTKKRN